MSPEQARGLPVDKRTDIWAFGCVLYELLTGRRPFAGTTASDSIAAVLEHDPDLTILPADTPPAVRSLMRHCLEKDPKRRLRDIADARLAIDDVSAQPADDRGGHVAGHRQSASARTSGRRRALWMLAGLGLAAAVVAVSVGTARQTRTATRTQKVIASVVLPGGMRLTGRGSSLPESRFAVSPDGRRLAWSQLMIRVRQGSGCETWPLRLSSRYPAPRMPSYPFWSPDSESIAFIAAGKLKTIRASGGSPMTVCDGGFRTGAWSRDGFILFAPAGSSPLYRVPASGGEPTPVTTLDKASGEVQHSYPAFLPDGRHFLYSSVGSRTGGALDPRGRLPWIPGCGGAREAAAARAPPRPDMRTAMCCSSTEREVDGAAVRRRRGRNCRGAPFPLVEHIKVSTAGATGVTGAFSVSEQRRARLSNGSPPHRSRPGSTGTAGNSARSAASADYGDVALSPNGATLAVSIIGPARSTRDLWLYDVDGGRGQRLTTSTPADEFAPVWSPDGKRLLFSVAQQRAASISTSST